jgi:hypothetical protein
MARWHQDDVDVACEAWGFQWVSAFARPPDRASRYIGPLGCTLGRVRELHDGAGSSTDRDRHWPEVFLGQGLLVAIALQAMAEMQRLVIWHHYVGRCYDQVKWVRLPRPSKQIVVAQRLGISLAEYYHRRDTAKACVRVALTLDTKDLARARGLTVQDGQASEVPVTPA